MKLINFIGKRLPLWLVAAALLGAGTAFAAPAQIILIRHAEKPEAGFAGNIRAVIACFSGSRPLLPSLEI
ncbi:MAG: hypothetical protein AUJ51_08465 [Elusimicrobia bacterium CG1_02_56_21]|nr:MAG: hypothetical protein AUJ51_08465 [Elusimicrobia bacterium CG1_02_56_21]